MLVVFMLRTTWLRVQRMGGYGGRAVVTLFGNGLELEADRSFSRAMLGDSGMQGSPRQSDHDSATSGDSNGPGKCAESVFSNSSINMSLGALSPGHGPGICAGGSMSNPPTIKSLGALPTGHGPGGCADGSISHVNSTSLKAFSPGPSPSRCVEGSGFQKAETKREVNVANDQAKIKSRCRTKGPSAPAVTVARVRP